MSSATREALGGEGGAAIGAVISDEFNGSEGVAQLGPEVIVTKYVTFSIASIPDVVVNKILVTDAELASVVQTPPHGRAVLPNCAC